MSQKYILTFDVGKKKKEACSPTWLISQFQYQQAICESASQSI